LTAAPAKQKIVIMADQKKNAGARKERLAKALKANLSKRKQQAKARDSAPPAPEKPEKH
jgi:hypothetical protein